MTDILLMMGAGLAVNAAMMFALWLVQARHKNAGIVDVGWTAGLLVMALIGFGAAAGDLVRKTMVLFMVTAWALRLILLLFRRFAREKEEDKRYQKIRAAWGARAQLNFLGIFLFQAVLSVVLAVPFLLISRDPSPAFSGMEWAGIVIWVIGFLGEVTADEQLARFKKDPGNKGRVCDIGLWSWSRHPNYFFEWTMWIGYAVLAFPAYGGWWGIIAPVLMEHFLMNVTGVPLAEEQSLKSRGEEYRRYQARTSVFIPLPPKKGV